MDDLEKVLKIAEEIEAERIKKYEDILLAFMQKESRFSLKNLDPWILSAGGVQYSLNDLKCSKLSQSDLKQAAQNLGFYVEFSDAIEFLISISDTEISTPAKELFDNYKSAFTQEKERIENLTQEYYNALMFNIDNKKDIKVVKKERSFFIEVKLPIPCQNNSFSINVNNYMVANGFTDVYLSTNSCQFEIPIK